MKNKRTIALFMLACLLFTAICPTAGATDYSEYTLPVPTIGAQAAIIVELDGDRVLYGKNENTAVDPASLTKVMTVLLAVEAIERGEASLDDVVTVGPEYNVGVPENTSSIVIKEGEKLTLRDLIYCSMLGSVNETCNVIAMHLTGSLDAFVALMNTRAKELGCENTRFVNTNGITKTGHFTTASELAVIVKEALSHKLFAEVCGTSQYTVPATNMNAERLINNTNALICPQSSYGSQYVYPGAYGVKTGYTEQSGYCLAAAAEKNGVRVLVIVLGCGKTEDGGYGNFVDTVNLLDWSFNNFSIRSVLEKGTKVGEAEIKNGDGTDRVGLVTAESVRSFLPAGLDVSDYQTVLRLDGESVKAPVTKGDRLGTVTVLDANGEEYGTVEVVAAEDVGANVWNTVKSEVSDFFSQWWMTALAIGITLAIAVCSALVILSRRRRKKEEERRRRIAAQKQQASKKRKAKEAQRKYYEDFFKDESGGKKRK